MRHPKTKHVYIGEVLDIYTQASGSHYGSVIDANGASGLSSLSLRVYRAVVMDIVCNLIFVMCLPLIEAVVLG